MIQVGYRDALGNERSDIDNEIFKTNLDVNGNPIGQKDKTKVFLFFSSSFSNRWLPLLLPKKKCWERVKKVNLSQVGYFKVCKRLEEECGDCFGAGEQGACCNTCEKLIEAYRKKKWNIESVIRRARQVFYNHVI